MTYFDILIDKWYCILQYELLNVIINSAEPTHSKSHNNVVPIIIVHHHYYVPWAIIMSLNEQLMQSFNMVSVLQVLNVKIFHNSCKRIVLNNSQHS